MNSNEKLHTYRLHHDSHSHRGRTYSEVLRRIKSFTKLGLELLHFSDCDTEKYTEAIMKIEVSSMKYLLRAAAKKREKAGPISHMRDTGGRKSEDFFKTEEEWDRKRRS